jgi:UDP-N-acetylglucosamine 2-epimerase (hydrolysing)
MKKKVLFLTGTRADFGKLKSLIRILSDSEYFHVDIFATGMHMDQYHGYTVVEIEKSGFSNIFKYTNYESESSMELVLAKTIEGLSQYIKQNKPDLIILHGDRVEALAGAIVGSLNNILVAHVEGGEVSGTVDELLRHAVSKLSHLHFVANESAEKRLIQMGEDRKYIFKIGSPDIDVMLSPDLPSISEVLDYYSVPFREYAILAFHPVTTEVDHLTEYSQNIVDAICSMDINVVGIFPNNDWGNHYIRETFVKGFKGLTRITFFPSIRFEYFVVLLKNAKVIIGNSSSGVREAPFLGIPSVDIGSRQHRRSDAASIIRSNYQITNIKSAINEALSMTQPPSIQKFGQGNSDKKFLEVLSSDTVWDTPRQKYFHDFTD